ncbi:MAG: type IX secretion system sortase PorU, partial [Bacteroidota bacterium]
ATWLTCMSVYTVYAQQRTPVQKPKSHFNAQGGTFIPEWLPDGKASARNDVNKLYDAPVFKGAEYGDEIRNLPYYVVSVNVGQNESVTVSSADMEGMEETSTAMFRESVKENSTQVGQWYPEQAVVAGPVVTMQGRRSQQLRIYPIQISADGSRMRKANAVNYSLGRKFERNKYQNANARAGYVSESVLRSGTWYKIAVTGEGLYKLDRDYLQNLGIDVNSIDPRRIQIYGNGGGMLPQTAGDYPYDDLVENAIVVSGEGDGNFGSGDYVLFYNNGPNPSEYSNRLKRWWHRQNYYSDSAFVFLRVGSQNGRRVGNAANPGAATHTPTSTTRFVFHEEERLNPLQSGRVWLGETFDLTPDQRFSFGTPRLASGSEVKVSLRVVARSHSNRSTFNIRENGTTYASLSPYPTTTSYGSPHYYGKSETLTIPAANLSDGSTDLDINFSKAQTSSVGYLDFIDVEFKQRLDIAGNSQWYFTATEDVGPGEVFEYSLNGGSNSYTVWDITDPVNVQSIPYSLSGGQIQFDVAADSTKKFVAFTGSNFNTPTSARRISNQNLHSLPQADYILVTSPEFRGAADQLAEFHRSRMGHSVNVANVDQIYNEFSSGAQDITAIRDFVKMFYDRPGTTPKYVLLFGDGSYDYKYISHDPGTNHIPTYQSRNSQRPTTSYTSDDYYGFLDDGEGFWGESAAAETEELIPYYVAGGDTFRSNHNLDVGVGRIPVATSDEAYAMVRKITDYAGSQEGFGPWRTRVVLVADHKDDDGDTHIRQADSYTPQIEVADRCINVDKLYMDNYTMESTASGDRFPDGKEALLRSLDEGSLIVNYTGHGGEVGWSNASILDISDINQIENGAKLPAYITATCEFGRWDDPGRRSGAEVAFLRDGAGSIAMLTTVRVVYSSPNYTLNQRFYDQVFTWDTLNDRRPTLGEVFFRTKNASWGGTLNNRNFSLLGDPGLTLAYPKNKAVVTKINGTSVTAGTIDSLPALSLVTVEGEVRDAQDNLLPTFNGDLFMQVFDKAAQFTTRREPFQFVWQKNRVFKGSGTVENGTFRFQFVVPIDISYEDQIANLSGKISLYFNNPETDGGGCNTDIFIGGDNANAIADDQGPMLEIYMNDEKFADGGMTGPNPTLVADVFDENGLNTVGTGIGHELTAILDENEQDVIVLNDYYEANKNSYQEGLIQYPFRDLEQGEHSLKVKVWDVANNSSERSLTFVVADDATFALGHVLNYPNPFTTNTKFFIEHNRHGSVLSVDVQIYTVAGNLVKSLEDTFIAEGNLYCDMEWDGLDEYGDALGRGVYVYKVRVKDENTGDQVSKFEKLVVLR